MVSPASRFLDDGPKKAEHLFSSRHACPSAATACPRSSRAVLVQQPGRRLPDLRRPGRKEFFDPRARGRHPTCRWRAARSAAGIGATPTFFQLIQALARHYDFDIEKPWNELPENVQGVLLFGSGDEVIEFREGTGKGKVTRKRHPFEGILPNLERRYRETESPPCARSWRSTSACAPAPIARAPG
jgi:excinuclease ABC subunit A